MTPGILCTNSYVASHVGGVGDHRFQVHDFCTEPMLGINYPKFVKPSGRAFYYSMERTIKKYNAVLKELMVIHRAYEKLERLYEEHDSLSVSEFQLIFNQWDSKVIAHKRASENQCNKFLDGKLVFSLWSAYGSAY